MSATTIAEAFIPVDESYKEAVMENTWGHLAPRRNIQHKGLMLFARSEYGDLVILNSAFAGLDDSPWLFQAMMDFVCENTPAPGIYKFTGSFRNYKFVGDVAKVEVGK